MNGIMNGIKLITKEREEQILKHNRTIELDVEQNRFNQLSIASSLLAHPIGPTEEQCPVHWDIHVWNYMRAKSHEERLVIAGALCAAELDRIKYIKEQRIKSADINSEYPITKNEAFEFAGFDPFTPTVAFQQD